MGYGVELNAPANKPKKPPVTQKKKKNGSANKGPILEAGFKVSTFGSNNPPALACFLHPKNGIELSSTWMSTFSFIRESIANMTGLERRASTRLLMLLLYDLPINGIALARLGHETYGHYFQALITGFPNTYQTFPGLGGIKQAGKHFLPKEDARNVYLDGGGINYTQLFAKSLAQTMAQKGEMRYNLSLSYLAHKMDLIVQLIYDKIHPSYNGGSDIEGYLYDLNGYRQAKYGAGKSNYREAVPERAFIFGALFNLLEPTSLLAAYNIIKYAYSGDKTFNIDVPFVLPRTHFYFSPEGPLMTVNLPYKFKSTLPGLLAEPYVKFSLEGKKFFGFGAEFKNLELGRFSFEGAFDVWKNNEKWGGGFEVGGKAYLRDSIGQLKKLYLGLFYEWKTEGPSFDVSYPAGSRISAGFGFSVQ